MFGIFFFLLYFSSYYFFCILVTFSPKITVLFHSILSQLNNFIKITNTFLFSGYYVLHEKFWRECIASTKTGARERSITKLFFTFEADSPLKFMESAFKDDHIRNLNPLSANPTKWSYKFRQFVGNSWGFVWVCLTILSGLHLMG